LTCKKLQPNNATLKNKIFSSNKNKDGISLKWIDVVFKKIISSFVARFFVANFLEALAALLGA